MWEKLLYPLIPGLETMVEKGTAFVTAVRREKVYAASHGSVKVKEQEMERISLTDLEKLDDKLVFSGGGHRLTARLEHTDRDLDLYLQGEDGWAYEFCLPAIDGEAVFGGGEQYRKLNLRGEKVVNFVSEHIKAATIAQKALLPRFLYREKEHSQIGSYAPMPTFVTDRGRLFLFDTDADGYSRFGNEYYTFSFDFCPAAIHISYRENLSELTRRINELCPSRQYVPQWCHEGMILGIQGGDDVIVEKAFAMLDAGARVSAVWSQDWSGENITAMGKQVWWNWEADEKLYPRLPETVQKLKSRGVRFLAYINPYLVKDSTLYNYCKEKGYLIKRRDGDVYHIRSTTFDAGMLDLTNPEAVRYIKDTLIKKNMLSIGVSGWMADFGEYLPIDCVLYDGDPARLHNRWPVLWAKLNREAIEEYGDKDVMFFTRSGYLGIQKYAPIMWNGDQHTDYTKDYGMPCVMPASFSLGLSGAGMVHSDIGGFFSFGKLRRDGELFTRWMEMCCFSLLMRSHEAIRPWANAQFDAEDVKEHTVRLTNIHAALAPYIAHCAEMVSEGIPAMRPDFWPEGNMAACRDEYAYFLGDDLFVCPVIEKGAKKRRVHLPRGSWRLFWTGERFEGGKSYEIASPLGKIPVFYRADSSFAELFRRAASDNL